MRSVHNVHRLVFSALVAIVMLSTGCKKNVSSSPSTAYYMRFKLNGVQKEYKTAIIANLPDDPENGWYGGLVGGASDDYLNSMTANLISTEAIKENIEYEIAYQGSSYAYKVESTITYAEAGQGYSSTPHTFDAGYQSAKIKFTEIRDTYVKGTFSGIILAELDDPASVKYTVTDGEFYALRIKTPGSGPATPGTGDGFIEFTIDGKTQRIDEISSSSNSAGADFSDLTPGLLRYDCIVTVTEPLAVPIRTASLLFSDKSLLTTKEYDYPITVDVPIQHVLATFTFTNTSDVSKSYFYSVEPETSEAIVTLTKVETSKGGKVEGTFSITNMTKFSGNGSVKLATKLNLTAGKFRLTTE